MSKPIEQALNNLIPRHSGILPPELIELASSLLAQSRNKASNLKADEEIGRSYACANIACERLKTILNLPPIEPRPPINPRAYKKLYTYLDQTLTSKTPRKHARTPYSPVGNNGVHKALPQRHTPSQDRSFQGFRSSRSQKKGLEYASNKEKDERVPEWIAPVVRMLCREMTTKNAIPHVLAGVESVLCLPPPSTEGGNITEGGLQGKLPALIAAIWFYVSSKMIGKETSGDEVVRRRRLIVQILREAKEDELLLKKIGDGEDAWKGWEDIIDADVTAWIKELDVKAWLDMDWFLNIEENELNGFGDTGDEEEEWLSARNPEELERAGLGSMKLKKFDYLSEANKKEYKRWENYVRLEIERLIANGALDDGGDAMEMGS